MQTMAGQEQCPLRLLLWAAATPAHCHRAENSTLGLPSASIGILDGPGLFNHLFEVKTLICHRLDNRLMQTEILLQHQLFFLHHNQHPQCR